MEEMMLFYFYFVPQEEYFCLVLQLSRFRFQSKLGFKFGIYGANPFNTQRLAIRYALMISGVPSLRLDSFGNRLVFYKVLFGVYY